MARQLKCPDCGAELPENALKGFCPACLIAFASEVSGGEGPAETGEGSLVGDYELLREIRQGGMGAVFLARQRSLNRLVALKMIRGGQLAGAGDIQRFRTEAEAAANLDHPNIVPIYEIGEHEGRHFFSMKLIKGCSLAEQIADGHWRLGSKGAPERQRHVARLMVAVASAVHHAHERGVLHRDLKPSNILLDERGEPHLTDFGLAKILERGDSQTLSRAVLGTPGYMSPEQAAGKSRSITAAADIYSLGAILYELLTGKPPFEGETTHEILQHVQVGEPTRPRLRNPDVAADLEIICLKCLEKEPPRRYPTAKALAEDLERWLRGEPITARPAGRVERTRKWMRRNRGAVRLAAGVAFSLTLGLISFFLLQRFAKVGRWSADGDGLATMATAAASVAELHYTTPETQAATGRSEFWGFLTSQNREPELRLVLKIALAGATLAGARHSIKVVSFTDEQGTDLGGMPASVTGSRFGYAPEPFGERPTVLVSPDAAACYFGIVARQLPASNARKCTLKGAVSLQAGTDLKSDEAKNVALSVGQPFSVGGLEFRITGVYETSGATGRGLAINLSSQSPLEAVKRLSFADSAGREITVTANRPSVGPVRLGSKGDSGNEVTCTCVLPVGWSNATVKVECFQKTGSVTAPFEVEFSLP